ncbi:hypothetical protein QYE76_064939 [Lolium multiflorum]|uniref:Reverse transcriptase domain-containing protein n=1 Tax=Lolium multiflorum TaxID=4521 RepID=A0AAD8WAG1_LOLMU|nr:hypothetical protein QYE76_064939 [Lolium multiflorum]
MGFSEVWVNWIMTCVRSVRFAVRVNGSTLDTFVPSRGLRQGDPLSPYLFLFVADSLACLLRRETEIGRISPLKIVRRAPGITNLMFADDCLLFFRETKDQAIIVDNSLKLFQKSTGQFLNSSKCSLLFSSACPVGVQNDIKATLGVQSSSFEEKYLGLPTPEGRMKGEHFQPIMNRFTKRLTNWCEKFCSHAAKETHIKAVAQALPGYAMGVFKMTTTFCDQYEKLIRDYWWGDEEGQRKVHWLAWANLTKPKTKGGIGFRDIKLFNQALLRDKRGASFSGQTASVQESSNPKDAFHATVTCSKARALRQEMRKCWSLPPENEFRYTGRDWLQLLLDPLDDITRARVLLVLWRAWHLRNDVIHHKGDATIASSVIFLQSYLGETFNPSTVIHDEKGWTKLNIDGSFCASKETGGAGFVLRDSNGKVLVAACIQLHNCAEAEEVEATAVLLGLLQMENMQVANMIIESDCYVVVKALLSNDQDRSKWCAVLEEAKACTRSFAACRVLHVRREANSVADALARLARTSGNLEEMEAVVQGEMEGDNWSYPRSDGAEEEKNCCEDGRAWDSGSSW